jgi:hypothetical protein
MRSLLIPLIILAWLGCGYWSVRLIAKDEKDKPFFEDGGDVFFGFYFLLAGPLALIVSLFATMKPSKRFRNCLNRMLGSKTIPIIILSAAMLGGCGEKLTLNCKETCLPMAVDHLVIYSKDGDKQITCECSNFREAYNKGEK